jgi:hypothetical protein
VSKSRASKKAPVRLNRKSPDPYLVPFTEHFQGFERVEAVRSVFGDKTVEVLKNLRIGFIPNRGMYMGIRDNDGNIAVGTYHLKNSPTRTLYLDIVHELFHINQRMTNGKWFHDEFMKFMQDRALYYASPIEIGAYDHTVREAERIGMTPDEIVEYLKIGEPPAAVWKNFLKTMNLKGKGDQKSKITRFPVKINRVALPRLFPFTDYFIGFEKVEAVEELLGDKVDKTLKDLKVEFIDTPFAAIYPQEEDGHLIVTSEYFRKGDTLSIYLDVILSLNLLTKVRGGDVPPTFEADFGRDPRVISAYTAMVKEGRRLGVDDEELTGHLRLMSFLLPPKEYDRFLKSVGLKKKSD